MKRWITLTILMVTGLSALLLADREYRGRIHQENAQALAQASAEAQNRLQVAFTMRLRAVEDLRAFMLAPASLPDNETFNRFAAGLLDHYHTIHGLAYIDSNRIVRYFYPLKGNESSIGLDLMTRPAAPFVEKAIRERRTTVNDPTVNVMGSLAVTPRVPLYREDQLLGLVQGVFDVSAILKEVLSGADLRFAAQLRDANGKLFWGAETFSGEAQTLPVQVGDNAWTLTIGWQVLPPGPAPLTLGLIWGMGVALLLSLLFIVNRTWTQTEWLRTAVSDRTAALRESEQRYRFLAENASDMIYRMSLPDGRYEYVSPSSTALFGYSPDEFYDSPLLIRQAIHPDWRGYFERAWADLVNGIAPPTYEYQIIHKSGATRWLNQRNVLLKNESGAPIAIQGIVTDISERKQAEEALARESHRNQVFLRNASDGVHILDADGNVLEVSDSFCKMLGYSREELIGANVSLWDAQWSPQELKQLIAQQIAKEGRSVLESRHQRRDGSVLDVEITGQGLELDGIPVLFNSARDVTARNQVEQSLQESERKYRRLIENSPDIVYTFSVKRGGIYFSSKVISILGYSVEHLYANPFLWNESIHPEDRAVVARAIEELKTGSPFKVEYRIKNADGDWRWLHDRSISSREENGDFIIEGLAMDITERKAAEEQLQQSKEDIQRYAEKLKTAFMSTVEVATTLSEMRDPYTAGHEHRVGKLAAAIGAELGFDAQRQEGLRVAGFLHDIGKITIPAEILSKPGQLSAIEIMLIQGHAQAGYEVLKDVQFPWPVAQVALQHHERLDGSGYPQGLKGEAILFEARILAVADVVEAMSSHRPYRPGLGIDKALAEIERGRGTFYDPVVADACLKLFREQGEALLA